ncbi:hypothetical protein [Bacillus sp. Marseille-Q1617]|uniref:hypothetical protein n=1 Tax=Bacillus sp. Marseille-Q1617 TaxID=2736887 RepID=UPI00158B1E7C|nr:hypothetical protein [Bacillus sp. Marseille-Q1617]
MMVWLILILSLIIFFAIVEEVIYFILRTRVIENNHKAKEGKIKSLYKKVKLKLSPS